MTALFRAALLLPLAAGVSSASATPLLGTQLELAMAESPSSASLDAARQALSKGDAARAAGLYEALAQQGESLEAEVGLIRASLQAGEFRKAVAYANLTAGEHPESGEAPALLAFLNDRAGRTEQAVAALKKLQSTRPDDWVPIAAHADILIDRLAPAEARAVIEGWNARHPGAARPELTRLLMRARVAEGTESGAAPKTTPVNRAATEYAEGWAVPSFQTLPLAGRRIVGAGNGVVVDGGKSVLTYAGVLGPSAHELLIRNGLGQLRRARVERLDRSKELIQVRLTEPFPATSSIPQDQVSSPEGVRFCFALGFSVPRSADPAYPAIAPGLVFRADTGVGGLMQITSALGSGHDGAPVFDARGKLIGLALGAGDHQIAGQDLRKNLGRGGFALRVDETLTGVAHKVTAVRAPPGPQPPMPPMEELFERLSPAVVQIVALE